MIYSKDTCMSITLLSASYYCCRLITSPIQVIYLLSCNISLQNLILLQVISHITCLVLNYPLGLLTDRYNYKKLVHIGFIFTSLYYIIYLFIPNLISLIIAEIFLGIGITLVDLNLSVWIANKTRYAKTLFSLNYYTHFDEEIRAVGTIVFNVIFCLLTLSITKKILYESIYILTIGSICGLHYFLYGLPNNQSIFKKSEINIVLLNLKTTLKSSSQLLFLLVSSLIWCAYQPLFYYWQPLLNKYYFYSHLKINYNVEFILGLSSLLGNTMSLLFHKLIKKFIDIKINQYLFGVNLALGSAMCYWLIGICNENITLCLIFYSVLQGLMSVLWRINRNYYLQNNDPQILGRLLSLANICASLSSIILLGCLYYLINLRNIEYLFKYSSSMLIATAILSLLGNITNKRRT